jgi:DNA invertase Pin-like site-specific DNA recombinase
MVTFSDCARLVGYARVSTQDQNLSLQIDALLRAGVSKDLIFTDKASGAKYQRPGLDACLEQLRSGDVLLDWRLDRLGRSVRHLVTLIDELREKQIGFRSVCDGAIDTTTPSGELIFHVFSALAQFERRLIQERTNAGLAAARARGPPCAKSRSVIRRTKRRLKSLPSAGRSFAPASVVEAESQRVCAAKPPSYGNI